MSQFWLIKSDQFRNWPGLALGMVASTYRPSVLPSSWSAHLGVQGPYFNDLNGINTKSYQIYLNLITDNSYVCSIAGICHVFRQHQGLRLGGRCSALRAWQPIGFCQSMWDILDIGYWYWILYIAHQYWLFLLSDISWWYHRFWAHCYPIFLFRFWARAICYL